MKTPVIIKIFKSGQLLEVKQFLDDQVIIGNEAEVQIDLRDPSVSPIHCLIELRDSGYYICDLGSQAGTIKNGKPVLDEPLSSGDTVVIGEYSIQFFVGIPKPKAPPAMTVAPPQPAVVPPPPAPAARPEPAVVPPKVSPAVPTAAPAPRLPEQPAASPSKKSGGIKGSDKSSKGRTFAPPSVESDLRHYLKPTRGNTLEVVVSWKERVLEIYHFKNKSQIVKAGPTKEADVFVPGQFFAGLTPLVSMGQGQASIAIPDRCEFEMINATGKVSGDDLVRLGKVTRSGVAQNLRLESGDMACLSVEDGTLQFFIRFVPDAPTPAIMSLIDLSGSEVTGMIVSIVLVSLLALYMSVYTPDPKQEEKVDETIRIAKFEFNKPPSTPTPVPTPEPEKVIPPPVVQATPTPKPEPTPEPKKIQVTEKKIEQKTSGKKESVAANKERPSDRAAEVRPNPSKTDRPKKFTSVKQGGAVKVGNTAGANANSPADVTKTGLLSAFGGGGNRSKLDQAYTGSGELLGMADKATGTSGQNESRSGDDIGSKFKDAGAGGKGTATQGIAGIGTKGRGSGQNAYGGVGFGGKGNVSIDAGGTEADFVGTIDREAVRRVIRTILSQIKSCYERQLRVNSTLEGKIVIQFEIEEQGRVRAAKTKSTSLNDAQVESCVASRIREQRFPEPPPGTVAVVDYPFVFGSQR